MSAGILERKIAIQRKIVDESMKYKNLEVYNFSFDFDIVNNMSFYKDSGHYNADISNQLLKEMSKSNKYFVQDRDEFSNNQQLFLEKLKKIPILWP